MSTKFEYTNQGAMGPRYGSLIVEREPSGKVAVWLKSPEGGKSIGLLFNKDQQKHLGNLMLANTLSQPVSDLLPIINLSRGKES